MGCQLYVSAILFITEQHLPYQIQTIQSLFYIVDALYLCNYAFVRIRRNGNSSLYILLSYSCVRQNDLTFIDCYSFGTTICSLFVKRVANYLESTPRA